MYDPQAHICLIALLACCNFEPCTSRTFSLYRRCHNRKSHANCLLCLHHRVRLVSVMLPEQATGMRSSFVTPVVCCITTRNTLTTFGGAGRGAFQMPGVACGKLCIREVYWAGPRDPLGRTHVGTGAERSTAAVHTSDHLLCEFVP